MDTENYQEPTAFIYLDFDEVVITERARLTTGLMVDSHAVILLRRLCMETGARIVVSSCWEADMPSALAAGAILKAMGFELSDLFLHHPTDPDNCWRIGSGDRGEAILEHFARYPGVKRFVAIDDSIGDMQAVENHHVHVDGLEGFGVRDYYRAKHLLGEAIDAWGIAPFKPQGMAKNLLSRHEWLALDNGT